ncbi:MAG: hypothetical protein ACTHM7_16705 [Ginsengibacter sp.]
MEKLRARTGLTVANAILDNDGNYLEDIPDDFVGLLVSTDNSLTLDDYIDRKELIQFLIKAKFSV